ncbi:putative Uncharacterized lipoprotein YbbD [Mesotoga infera]|uniref:Putative Uncharacterized lipoprotein YbbD n=1 Tax=Mesotoga infera TaxID=1236046 RepID=A0A7Z7LEQ1_9BACT|nr:beta-N-acetylhexosaminidase [Mesotoga infera]SSC12607.1 putative Uncharacterized lipoprotein YbbD [Mesotoga infera]
MFIKSINSGIISRFFSFGFGLNEEKGAIGPSLINLLEEGVSAFNLSARNVVNPPSLWNLIGFIRERSGSIPFIMSDEEGGPVKRLVPGFTRGISHMGLAKAGPSMAYDMANCMAREASAVGVNVFFSPVLDCNSETANPIIGIRSFSADPHETALLGAEFCKGLHSAGVLTTGKHFPGHGATREDSHLCLPVVDISEKTFRSVHLFPFEKLIGEDHLDFLMTAHIVYPSIDDKPATLSRKILTTIAREELGFTGVIITDCLEMDAMKKIYGIERATVDAFNAGADMILLSHTPELQRKAIEAMKGAVEDGTIPMRRVKESLLRIEETREKLSRQDYPYCRADFSRALFAPDDSLQKALAEKSVVIWRNGGNIPLEKNSAIVLVELSPTVTGLNEVEVSSSVTRKIVSRFFKIERSYTLGYDTPPDKLVALEELVNSGASLVVITASRGSEQIKPLRETLERLAGKSGKSILISGRDPYDADTLEAFGASLATFGLLPDSIEAACMAICGELK